MHQLPTGTVTFLFSDIEGSTRLLRELGDGYAAILRQHCEIIRGVIGRTGGFEVRTEGDSFFVVFPSATGAVGAAVDIQRGLAEHAWPQAAAVRVRIGIHTGEGLIHEADYVGIDVHRAARIAASARRAGGRLGGHAGTGQA